MPLKQDDLDGKYLVHSESTTGGVNGDGETEIKNGLTYRTDKNGFVWESSFSVIGENEVQMESTVDPGQAGPDKQIKDQNGVLTSDVVVFRSVLNATNENGKLILEGTIRHGEEITRLQMKKV